MKWGCLEKARSELSPERVEPSNEATGDRLSKSSWRAELVNRIVLHLISKNIAKKPARAIKR